MPDRPVPDLSDHFGRLRSADVPDVWPRVVAEIMSDDVSLATAAHTPSEIIDDVDSTAPVNRFGARRWLGAAAAALLVAGVVAGLVWTTGADAPDDLDTVDAPIPAATPGTPVTVAEVPAPTAAPMPVSIPFGNASIDPAITPAGSLVTLTPTGTVELICAKPGTIHSATDDPELLGLVGIGEAGSWSPNGPDGVNVLACAEAPSSAPASYRVPDQLAPGDYILCLDFDLDPAGCATFTVIASTAASTAHQHVRRSRAVHPPP